MSFLLASRGVLFWVLSTAVALVSWRFLVLGVPVGMPFMAYHLDGHALALYAHIGLAPVALIVLPFQLSTRVRKARPGLHRWMGRIYGLAVVLSGMSGLVLALTTRAGTVAAWGFGVLAVLWLGATVWAVWLAMAGRIAAHRRWMLRSAAMTFAAATLRVYLPILTAAVGFDAAYGLVAWVSWVPNLVIAEWWLRRR